VAGAYYLNQIFDEESDRLNDKLGFLQGGMASRAAFWILFGLTSAAGLAIAAWVSPYLLVPVGIQFLLGVVYSVPPFRLKDRPWLGLLTNAICFGWLVPVVAFSGVWLQYFYWIDMVLHPASPFFFLAVGAAHAMTTIPDMAGDKRTGKCTLAVAAGAQVTRFVAVAFTLLAAAIAWFNADEMLLILAFAGFVTILAAIVTKSEKADLLAAKLPLLLLTIYAGWIYPYYAAFVVALIFATRVYYRKRFGITYPELA